MAKGTTHIRRPIPALSSDSNLNDSANKNDIETHAPGNSSPTNSNRTAGSLHLPVLLRKKPTKRYKANENLQDGSLGNLDIQEKPWFLKAMSFIQFVTLVVSLFLNWRNTGSFIQTTPYFNPLIGPAQGVISNYLNRCNDLIL